MFAVPLRDGRFSIGLIARSPHDGKILLGYFFRCKFAAQPSSADVPTLSPDKAIKSVKFGDLSLMKGEWPVIKLAGNWNRNDWPMPKFLHRDALGRRSPRLMLYADDDPSRLIAEEPCTSEAGYENDYVLGAGSAEIMLTQMLEAIPPVEVKKDAT